MMMDAPLIDIRPGDWQIVRTILEKHVPSYEVWAFGSRARWEAKDYSDLDLAIITEHPLTLDVKSALDSDFAESDLSFKVDVVDWATASPSFREIIQRENIVVKEGKKKKGSTGEWVERFIGEIAEVIGGSTPSTNDPANFGGDIPWLTPKDLSEPHPRYISRGARNLSNKGLARCSAQVLPINSILLSSRAPIGYLAIAADPISTNQGFRSLVVKPNYDHEFIYYWLKQNVAELERHASGSTFKELSGAFLKNIPIRLPSSKAEQHAIAHILAILDDKIELNRKMNKTLEAMARAIFKSWFVNFEPVRAKAERRDPGLPKPLSDLFPDSFLDSELGEIPRGWIAGPILKHARLLSGGTPKTDCPKYWNGNILWASAKDVSQCGQTFLITTDRTITNKGFEESATQLIPALCAVVVARGATTGRMVLLGREMAMNQTCYALASTTSTPFFLFCQLRQETDALVHAAHGSVFDTITTSTFANSKVVLPQKPILEAYEKMVSPLFLRILRNSEESGTLTVLRDTLLPKLISGKLRVKAAAECWQEMPDQQRMAF